IIWLTTASLVTRMQTFLKRGVAMNWKRSFGATLGRSVGAFEAGFQSPPFLRCSPELRPTLIPSVPQSSIEIGFVVGSTRRHHGNDARSSPLRRGMWRHGAAG